MTFLVGIIAALAMLFLLFKMNIRRLLAYDVIIDIATTAGLAVLFQGTYSGMIAAAVGGVVISIVLFLMKKTMGYERLHMGWHRFWPTFNWQFVPPKWGTR